VRILVLGGTQFLGRHVVDSALARGHDLTLFNRGRTRPELFPEVERLQGDRDGSLDALAGRGFDAVVDTSGYVPRIVAATIAALGDVGHYTFVSSISAYADLSTPPTVESPVAELAEPSEDWQTHYGALKALCENTVRASFPEAFVPRPGLIVGPWDPSGRFTYWPVRVADGGRVLAAAPATAPAQVIDGRDLADWIVRAAESGLAGTYNAIGPRTTIGALLAACVAVAGTDPQLEWVDPGFLAAHDVAEWLELPLWLHSPEYAGMADTDNARAVAAGLAFRPLAETIADTLAWARSGAAPAAPPAGLDRDKERRLLAAWDSEHQSVRRAP